MPFALVPHVLWALLATLRLGPNLDLPDPSFQVLQVSPASIKTPTLITVILS